MSTAGLLLERDPELEQLSSLLASLDGEGGKVVLIRGEAGIGKTSLVRAFLALLPETVNVLAGACDDLLTARPLGPFRDMSRDEPSLLDSLDAGNAPALMDTVLDLISRQMRPTVLVVEDTQWADEATLDVVRVVGRRIHDKNGLLLLTYRDSEVDLDHPLRGVIGALPGTSVINIRLAGLSLEAVSVLAAGSDLDPSEILRTTGGNPFLAVEMVSGDGHAASDSVQDSVAARARKMSLGAQQALTLLAVIPERSATSEVQRIIGADEELLVECERSGLVEIQGGLVGFRHELIRRAVEASMPGIEREGANRRVLESLPSGTDPARLAHHAREANDVDRLVASAPLAAEAARLVNSHREAVGHYRSLDPYFDRLEPSVRARMFEDWARSELLLENHAEAISKLNRALDTYRATRDAMAEGRCLTFAVRLNELSKRPDEASRCMSEAIGILEPLGPTKELAFATSQQAWLSMMRGDFHQAETIADRAISLSKETGNQAALVNALNTKGSVTYHPGETSGRAALEEASRMARNMGDAYEEVRALHNLAYSAIARRDLEFARETAKRTLNAAAKYKLPNLEKTAQADIGKVHFLGGDWDEAEALALEALDTTPDRSSAAARELYWLLGTIQIRKGLSEGPSNLDKAWSVMDSSEELRHMVDDAVSLAEHMWLTDKIDSGQVASFRKLLEDVLTLGDPWESGALSLWMWKLGEVEQIPDGIAEPYRLIMHGEAIAAARTWDELGYPYERAIALSHGDTRAQLEALELMNQLGADAVADKLWRELRNQGVSMAPPRRAGESRGGLTARQVEVLSLLAERLSNIEIADSLFLSPRTVENHVAAVMTKLAARTRNEAVAIATEQGLLAVG